MTVDELNEMVSHREYHPDLEQAVARANSYRPVVKANDKYLLGGFITFFQQQWDILRSVEPPLAVGLPPQCLDPIQIAGLFGIPLQEFDWPGDGPLARIEIKVDTLLKRGVASSQSHDSLEPGGAPQATQALVEIRRSGTDWHLRFQKDDISEEYMFQDGLLGFRCWELLLKNPGRRFDPEDLERMSNLPAPRRPRKLYLASSGQVDADADSGEVIVEGDDGDSVGLSLATEDEIVDPRTISDLDREIESLSKELLVTVNAAKREELEQQIRNNKTWRGKLVNKKGKPRPLTIPGKEAARKRVRNLLDRARAEIGKKMPILGRYLAVTESALEYDPARAV